MLFRSHSDIKHGSSRHQSRIIQTSIQDHSDINPGSFRHQSGIIQTSNKDHFGIILGSSWDHSGTIREASRTIRESKNHQKIKKTPFSKKISVPSFSRRDKSIGNTPEGRKYEEICPKSLQNMPPGGVWGQSPQRLILLKRACAVFADTCALGNCDFSRTKGVPCQLQTITILSHTRSIHV